MRTFKMMSTSRKRGAKSATLQSFITPLLFIAPQQLMRATPLIEEGDSAATWEEEEKEDVEDGIIEGAGGPAPCGNGGEAGCSPS